MSSDVNPDYFHYTSEDGKYRLEIASDGSIGLTVGLDKQPDRRKFTWFPYAKVRVLPPFTHDDHEFVGSVPGDGNDYSGVSECPLVGCEDCKLATEPEPSLVDQIYQQAAAMNVLADAIYHYNNEFERLLSLRPELVG